MMGGATWLELPGDPHPTSPREAAFSHEWEKEARPNILAQIHEPGSILRAESEPESDND
jgi:NADH:ubiquinone oxidoreductase subunit